MILTRPAPATLLRSIATAMLPFFLLTAFAHGQNAPGADSAGSRPIPDIRTLMTGVMDHQKQLEKVRENYTYRTSIVTEDIDSNGKVTKTESEDTEVFYVNTHRIERTVKKDGKPLNDHDAQKEQERIVKLVEKAQKVLSGTAIRGA